VPASAQTSASMPIVGTDSWIVCSWVTAAWRTPSSKSAGSCSPSALLKPACRAGQGGAAGLLNTNGAQAPRGGAPPRGSLPTCPRQSGPGPCQALPENDAYKLSVIIHDQMCCFALRNVQGLEKAYEGVSKLFPSEKGVHRGRRSCPPVRGPGGFGGGALALRLHLFKRAWYSA
jgi:hypothetical protein